MLKNDMIKSLVNFFWYNIVELFFQWKAGTTDTKYWGTGDPPTADADDRKCKIDSEAWVLIKLFTGSFDIFYNRT